MANPLRQLKYLPWTSLVIITGVTFASIIALEFLLWLTFNQLDEGMQSTIINVLAVTLYSPLVSLFTSSAIGVGVGALAVFLLETIKKQVFFMVDVKKERKHVS